MNKKSFLLIAITAASLLGCSNSKKVKSILEFTPKVTVEEKIPIHLGSNSRTANYHDPVNFHNYSVDTFMVDSLYNKKLTGYSLTKYDLACLPIINNEQIIALDVYGVLTATNLVNKRPLWSIVLKSSLKKLNMAGMVFNNGKLYIVANNELIEVEADSGRELMRKNLPDLVKSQPVAKKNALFLQTVSNEVIAYNIANWQLIWMHETWPEMLTTNNPTTPLIIGSQLITGYSSGQLVSIDVTNGRPLWQYNLIQEGKAAIGLTPISLSCQPITQDKYLYIASNNNNLIKIDITTAAQLWQRELYDVQTMVVAGNALYTVTNGRQVVALSTNNGKVIWVENLYDNNAKQQTDKPTTFFTPIVTASSVMIASKEGLLYELNPYTGVHIRQIKIPYNLYGFVINGKNLILLKGNKMFIAE